MASWLRSIDEIHRTRQNFRSAQETMIANIEQFERLYSWCGDDLPSYLALDLGKINFVQTSNEDDVASYELALFIADDEVTLIKDLPAVEQLQVYLAFDSIADHFTDHAVSFAAELSLKVV